MRTTTALAKASAAALALFVVAIFSASPSFAAPSLEVSATTLKDGQTVTLSGSGFKPGLKQIAAGQCIEGYTGPGDCNLQGGATFRNADDKGSIGTFTIVVKEKFGAHDCTKIKCVIAAAPLPGAADAATVSANQSIIPVTFGAAAAAPETPAPTTPAATPAASTELPKTGASDVLPMVLLGAGLFLVVGAGLRIGLRSKGGVA
ncbi:neocarzinostatin apoprotein domain-containing protein [Aeromicrobium sp. UC242_57]|uniref:neocarzinostatin apoprotein domain-containing protein n=1 Tax=Aeromicrobium sp. UC242_57 TaxID=3374624 RepID=UPI00378ACDA3